MKKNKNIITAILLTLLLILEIVKNIMFISNTNILVILIKDIYLILLLFLNNKYLKHSKISFHINILLLGISIFSLLFSSFNGLGYILLFTFLILITMSIKVLTKLNFEMSLVLSTSLLILLFILLGLLDILKFSYLLLLIITVTALIYLYKKKDALKIAIDKINPTSFLIFIILFIIAICGGVGRYIHKWDEYSYWAYAAKVCINEDSLYSVIAKTGSMKSYPPVSTIWHYIISIFAGTKESNLYIGLSILTYIYMMPVFMNMKTKNNFTKFIYVITIVFVPLLFNGSIRYNLIYVDLLLGILCTTAIITGSEIKEEKLYKYILTIILFIITMLKPNGFVFALSILLLLYLRDIFSKKTTIKSIFIELKKYIVPGIIIVLSFIAWRLFTGSGIIESLAYEYKLIPKDLETTVSSKMDLTFILNFITNVISSIDKDIIYSFINIPLFAYLIIVFILIYMVESSNNEKSLKVILPYIISYIIFYMITALSLFVMFTKYEASTLASFGRYLAPINIALILYALYKLQELKLEKVIIAACMVSICLVGFNDITYFFTDIRDRRETMHVSNDRQEIFSVINENTDINDRIFIINQTDDDTIMPIWYARYYCYPRVVNANNTAITWKIKTESNSLDLNDWGLTKETFEHHLIQQNFDYVFFYSITDELVEELSNIIEEKEDLKEYKLFKIIKLDDESIKLEKVEE